MTPTHGSCSKKEPIDESIQIGVPEVVVEHSDGDIQVLILALLVSTVLSEPG